MNRSDLDSFKTLINNVGALYGKDLTPGVKRMYWDALLPYDFRAIADAFGRHASNPDTGTFMPKPADIIRMLNGNTKDSALQAWAKVERAIRTVGSYRTVAFDDPLIHRVVTDMGGWLRVCDTSGDSLPFVGNEFQDRYRGYTVKSEHPDYPRTLTGRVDADRQARGLQADKVALIGDQRAAQAVMAGGSDAPPLTYTERKAVELPGGAKAISGPKVPKLEGPAKQVGGILATKLEAMSKKARQK